LVTSSGIAHNRLVADPPRVTAEREREAKHLVPGRGRIAALDGIRGVAILLVVCYHTFFVFRYVPAESAAGTIIGVTGLWWNGVDLFFVLSGFLIGGILIDARESPRYYRTFYARRAFRILPLYFAVVAIVMITSGVVPPLLPRFPWLAYLTLTQNFWAAATGSFGMVWLSPAWSLAIEEQFYLVAPALIRWTSRKRLKQILVATLLGAPLARVLFLVLLPHGAMVDHVLMFTRADSLMIGMGAAIIVRDKTLLRRLEASPGVLIAIALAAAAGVALFTWREWNFGSWQIATMGYSIHGLLFGSLLLLTVTQSNGRLAHLLSNKLLGFFGRRAYGIYLLHVPALYVTFLIRDGSVPRLRTATDFGLAVGSAALSVAVASISWRYFEKPLISRGHAWRY
jgi:peptidoglycan/LPS O-acetylase OafA/YrhL